MFLDKRVLRGLAVEEIQRDSWGHAIYSNRPREGEFNNLFPNLKKEGKNFNGYFRMNL
jgi:hypothetical protein